MERKGAYVKDLGPMDNDLPILNKALVDRMLNGTPVKQTINSCADLIMAGHIAQMAVTGTI